MRAISRWAGICGLIMLAVPAAEAQSGARLRLSKASYDFGTVWQNESPVYMLKVYNEGTENLQILDVRAT